MSPQNSADRQSASVDFDRKAYVAPDVVEYGSLADITLSLGKNGIGDGGTNINGKNFTRT